MAEAQLFQHLITIDYHGHPQDKESRNSQPPTVMLTPHENAHNQGNPMITYITIPGAYLALTTLLSYPLTTLGLTSDPLTDNNT